MFVAVLDKYLPHRNWCPAMEETCDSPKLFDEDGLVMQNISTPIKTLVSAGRVLLSMGKVAEAEQAFLTAFESARTCGRRTDLTYTRNALRTIRKTTPTVRKLRATKLRLCINVVDNDTDGPNGEHLTCAQQPQLPQ